MTENTNPWLHPAERIALLAAKGQLKRGENPPINTTEMLVMTIERLASPSPVSPAGREDKSRG